MANSNSIATEELRLLIERIENIEAEIKEKQDDRKDVYAEGKARGYDPKIMRQVVRDRKMEKQAFNEREALLETYRVALDLLS